mmetsp:Transcript_122781/g.392505  ORF Transcript_122781/g.392505 Transcript_122781/m.392505 type:complete len:110 (-) Transcript_122781:203-532(-)
MPNKGLRSLHASQRLDQRLNISGELHALQCVPFKSCGKACVAEQPHWHRGDLMMNMPPDLHLLQEVGRLSAGNPNSGRTPHGQRGFNKSSMPSALHFTQQTAVPSLRKP